MRKLLISSILFLIICTCILFFVINIKRDTSLDIVQVNDIVESITNKWENLDENNLLGLQYGLQYVVLDNNGELIAATSEELNSSISTAIVNRDTIIDIKVDDNVVGKLIIYNNAPELFNSERTNLFLFSFIVLLVVTCFCILYGLNIYRRVISPFKKLKGFAREVSLGNLDFPLEMDRNNLFGAFTESFDIMREELKKARESERIANLSKKELVASLSHDIKTPVASIKAISELMQLKTDNIEIKKQLEVIDIKAEQINTLITNLFNSTLEELQELKVTVTEESSVVIMDLIKESDYNKLTNIDCNSECIVLMDKLRLSQVIDNIISNSYKYANTQIDVSIDIIDSNLEVSFRDYGKGMSDEELPLVFNKFYRGNNSTGKSGTGLGLYISKYLMNQMLGDIYCENIPNGFNITIKLKIA